MSAHDFCSNWAKAPWRHADPGDAGKIAIADGAFVALVSAAAETRTLAPPTLAGLILILYLLTDGGDVVITAAETVNASGYNTITFANVGETLMLISVPTSTGHRWQAFSTYPETEGPDLSIV